MSKNEKSGQKKAKKQAGKGKGQIPLLDSAVSEASTSQLSLPPSNIKKEQPPPPQAMKKIIKAEFDEAKTLAKLVFKSDPNTQMKDFIKKAAVKQSAPTAKLPKTPAESHPPAVAQELLETDDDVADNLGRLFKTNKSIQK